VQSRFRWLIAPAAPASQLAELGVPDPLIAQVLYNRGLRSQDAVHEFLGEYPEISAACSPFSMPGIHEAVGLLRWALAQDKRILVYGDYDVDGVAATALLVEGLAALGGRVTHFIPNRLETGYGLDAAAIREIAPACDVLVSVDCGIRSLEEVALARRLGMRVVITDHHLQGDELPPADAIVSPRLRGGEAYGEIAGVGVAYELMRALCAVESRFGERRGLADNGLDLVALGTVADVASLLGYNRRLVRAGLDRMRRQPRLGVQALARRASLETGQLTAWHLAFVLGPRLNAAGRLGSALPSLQLLMSRDPASASALAEQLEQINRTRRQLLERCLAQARQDLAANPPTASILFTASESYPPGIVGLLASRLLEEWNLPVVAVALEPEKAHGSVRSTQAMNASQALDACSDLLDKHGGHSLAAGFACRPGVVVALRQRLEALASDTLLSADARPVLEVDAETDLPGGDALLWEWGARLEPTGRGNPRPILVSRGLSVREKLLMGREGEHLSLRLASDGHEIRAVGFHMGGLFGQIGDAVDIAYELHENSYNGTTERRLLLRDVATDS